VTGRALGKKFIRSKFSRTGRTPKPGRHILDGELGAVSGGAGCEGLKRELEGLGHNSAQGANPQTNYHHTLRADLPRGIQGRGQGALHDR